MRRRRRLAAAAGRRTVPGLTDNGQAVGRPLPAARAGGDRSCRPHRSPRRTPTRIEQRIITVRLTRRWGPARIAGLLGCSPATVHRVLTRHRLPRLAALDRATGAPVRRYERATPGEVVHVDIKKLGNIPDRGGHKVLGRTKGRRNRAGAGYSSIHTALDDHSRLAYAEILPDETAQTAVAFWARAQAYFTSVGIGVQRVLRQRCLLHVTRVA